MRRAGLVSSSSSNFQQYGREVQEDEDDGEITLEEFLREVDKSPKSRVSKTILAFLSLCSQELKWISKTGGCFFFLCVF